VRASQQNAQNNPIPIPIQRQTDTQIRLSGRRKRGKRHNQRKRTAASKHKNNHNFTKTWSKPARKQSAGPGVSREKRSVSSGRNSKQYVRANSKKRDKIFSERES
jgi:hypothetical protein